ncbi:type VII secretion protein EccCa [Plantactinospora sp. KBS50]|uniref:type VII secretion protein EccCa n=1 Tax=Plantactinospora sp. KBS50 TaxID=2024580 RepID=UPI000BAAC384|nr:type VII secretion protein EccCa [Plantactinospora sp. KBS50]ASW58055.1 type VII secretion protein EccC [Plantactinospora sp. KBS50]
MSTVVVRRPPRQPAPELPSGELAVAAPPEIPEVISGRWRQAMMILPMVGGSVAMAMMFGRGGGAYSYLVGAMFGVSSLAMLVTSWGSSAGGPRRAELIAARRDYLRHLAGLRRRARDTVRRQRAALYYRHPDPGQLWSTAASRRIWERRGTDPDFGVVRIGIGPQSLATPLLPPATRPVEELEPMTAGALRRFLDAYAVVPDLPVAVSLRGFARIVVAGPGPAGRPGPPRPATGPQMPGRAETAAGALARAVLIQLAVFHAPDELLIAVCAGPERRAAWEWVKWLPHALHPTRVDALGPVRLVTSSLAELERLLEDVIGSRSRFSPLGPATAGPHLLVLLDGADRTDATVLTGDGGIDAVTVLDLTPGPARPPDPATLVLELSGGRLRAGSVDGPAEVGTPDRLGLVEAESVARRLAPLRLATTAGRGGPDRPDPGLAELLGIGDPESYPVSRAWARRAERDRLRVPIGTGADGGTVELDLKESALDGMGPHGLLIGATGSGKSELLRTVVLGLAAVHSSEELNVVLVDFKGGATFAKLDRLPHTAAVITNLRQELPLVDRMVDAINGELVRRQELLRRAGVASLRDYDRARAGGTALAPLPTLLIVCDEFSELLDAKPDFIELFVQIGRVGRSLGVHLLLASQRLEEGRLRGLETHLSYRVGLRTFSALESRSVLGVPDAYELPRTPGHGFLRYGTDPLIRFRAAYVSGPRPRPTVRPADAAAGPARVLRYSTHFVAPPAPVPAAPAPAGTGESLLDVLVARMAGAGPPAHRVWLPPLDAAPALDELLGPVQSDPDRGLTVANPELRGRLQVPVAVLDKPYEQRRDPLWLPLHGAAGHVAVVGGPQSGKSQLLRTLLCALALTHTPAQVQVYCLDFGGGSLAGLRELPHVGGVAGRLDAPAVRRTVGEVAAVLTARERSFAAAGIESMADYRRHRAADDAARADAFGDVFLVVDGWPTLRGEYDDLEPMVTDLATRGLSYGVHVVASAPRWLDFRPAIRDLFGSRLELRLGDPADSLVSRHAAGNVPEKAPGRGITTDGLHLLCAVPALTAGAGTGSGTADLVAAVRDGWSGPPAPPVRLLPPVLPYADLDPTGTAGLRLPIGVAEADLRTVALDFAGDPHFLLFGDAEAGKSSFLRALAASIAHRFAPEQARMILVDYRRSLLGAVETEHLIGYGTAAAATADLVESAAGYLQRRLPPADVTAQQLRDRSWWTGPELFVLVDDYDLVAAGPANPLQALAEFLPQARDIGLHLVLTRRTGGAARALYDPIIQRLRELSSPGLVLSGDPDEGPLLGAVRPAALPSGRGRLVTRREGVRLIQLAYLQAG